MQETKVIKPVSKLRLILVAVFLILIGFVFYKYLIPKKLDVITTPSPTVNEVQNLYKKYVNKKVGYEITIPIGMYYEEKMEGQFVTFGDKIIVYLLDSDPEKCSEECPVVDSKETVNINGQNARFFKLHWKYDGVNTPQSFVNYVFSLKDKYLVFQLQEVDFSLDVDINHKIVEIGGVELEQFNKIVGSLVLSQ